MTPTTPDDARVDLSARTAAESVVAASAGRYKNARVMRGAEGMESLAGRQVGRYWVEDRIGQGGMGEVYSGYDPTLRRRIVVKRLHPELPHDAERSRRLEHEAQLHGQLSHPNIVRVYDFVSAGEADYIISELVEGGTLGDLAARGRLSLRRALDVLVQAARAMEHSHSLGIIHRDLKLDNVLVTRDGNIKVTDFGLSRSSGAPADDELAGTISAIAPEQLWGKSGDGRSDLFSFGVMAYELLAARHPFEGRTTAETMRNLMERAPLPLRTIDASIPVPISELVDRLLAKSPDARPGSFTEVIAVLVDFLGPDTLDAREQAEIDVRQVAALYLRVHGAEDAPVDTRTLLTFQRSTRAALPAASGHLVFGADRAALVVFGYPEAHERNACAAAELAAQLQEKLASAGLTLAAGLDLGDVAILPGEPAPILVGDVLDHARALGVEAGAGRMLTVGHVRGQLLAGGFRVQALAEDRPGHARFEVDRSSSDQLFDPIGRDEALRGLEAELRAVFLREGAAAHQAVAIDGEAGIGKTTFVQTIARRAGPLARRVLGASISPSDRYVPFAVARKLIVATLGQDTTELRAKIADVARELAEPLVEAAVAQIVGVATEVDRERLAMLAGDGQGQLATLAARFLLLRDTDTPTLTIVEDLHWADSGSIAFVEELARRVPGTSMFLLVTHRPELKLPWSGEAGRRTISLGRLDRAEGRAVLARIEGSAALAPNLVESILARADGVPLWLEELTHSILEQTARGTSAFGPAVPASLKDSIQYRLQLMGARTRRTAELASAIGGTVSTALLQAAAGITASELQADLEALEARGLVRRQGLLQKRELTFRHALMETSVYAGVEPRTAELHAAIVRALESGVVGDGNDQPAFFAQQYQRAGRRRDAVRWWMAAGERAAEGWAHELAVTHYQHALELVAQLEEGDAKREEERRVRVALGLSLIVVVGLAARPVEENNARILVLGEGGGDAGSWFGAYLNWAMSYVTANVQGMTAWTGILQERADHLPPEEEDQRPGYEFMLAGMRALLQYHPGSLSEAIATFEAAERIRPAALSFFAPLPDKSHLVLPGTYSAMCYAILGDVAAAREAIYREERTWPEGSAELYTAQTVGPFTFALLHEWDEVRRLTQSVLSSPPGMMNPTHLAFSSTLLQIAELARLRETSSSQETFADQALRLVEAIYAYMVACSETGLVIGVLLQQSLCADAALELVEHPSSPPALRARALEIADAIIGRGVLDLERPSVEILNRNIAAEFHRVHARLAALKGDIAGARAALDRAEQSNILLSKVASRSPELLIGRCNDARTKYLSENAHSS
jgi:tRNA A-37 threonylcarbamoyl transferase component Bud32